MFHKVFLSPRCNIHYTIMCFTKWWSSPHPCLRMTAFHGCVPNCVLSVTNKPATKCTISKYVIIAPSCLRIVGGFSSGCILTTIWAWLLPERLQSLKPSWLTTVKQNNSNVTKGSQQLKRASICCSVTHLMVRGGRGAEWAQGVFTWCGGCVVPQGLGLCRAWGCWAGGRPLPLGGASWNVPVVDTGHVCDLLPSWRQVRVRLEWLLTPDIWWKNTHI